MIRHLLLFVVFLLPFQNTVAQQYMDTHDPGEIKSLLNRENVLNGFGGVDSKVGNLLNSRTLFLGAYGGLLINRHFMLGIAAYGWATPPEFEGFLPDGTPKPLTLYGGYAGIMLGGIVLSRELVHLSFPVVLGAGQADVSDTNFFTNYPDTDFTIESSTFFVGEPTAQLEFNITPSFRIAAGASYRIIRGLQLQNVSDKDLTNWAGVISLRFGRF